MPESFPRITLSINRRSDGSRSTGDLNSLCLGFGIFQVWLYLSVFGVAPMFTASDLLPWFPYLPEHLAPFVLYSFLIVGGLFLLIVGFTNQLFLHFYVSRRALTIATSLCSLGTLLLYTTCIEGIGPAMAVLAGMVMGAGSSLLLAQWGTTFARFQFATIIVNTSVAFVLGMLASVICANWVPAPISGIITVLLPILSAPILLKLIPTPFYVRKEAPIFHPLEIRPASFTLRLGIPVFIIGIALGALRMICVGEILPASGITMQLVIGAACATSIIVYIIAIALTKRDMFWDSLFRFTIPVTMLGIGCIPLLLGDTSLLAGFCTTLGYICLEVLMWVFFAGISQEFRLSPIFIFGIGRGLLEIGSGIGSALVQAFYLTAGAEIGAFMGFVISIMVVLSLGYALMPRYREMKTTIYFEPTDDMAKASEQPGTLLEEQPLAKGEEVPLPAVLEGEIPSTASKTPREQAEKGSFYRKCEEISDRYLLSHREREVLRLLAKGHNAAFIQDKLCVSRSTAKTHINHIYKKLNIHTQQELLTMVEEREHGAHQKNGPSTGPATGSMGAAIAQDQQALRETALQAKESHERDMAKKRKGRSARKNIFG